jgi:hypothetical protein
MDRTEMIAAQVFKLADFAFAAGVESVTGNPAVP